MSSITCPICGKTSHNPTDVREGYCGFCHNWTRDINTSSDLTEAERAEILMWADRRAIEAEGVYTEEEIVQANLLLTSAVERIIAARFVPRTDVTTEPIEDMLARVAEESEARKDDPPRGRFRRGGPR